MKKLLILPLLALMLLPSMVSAQWKQDTTFKAFGTDNLRDVHGVAVDPDGKIWMQPYYATEVVKVNRTGDSLSTTAIYVYNADGTPADFSPLFILEWADGTTPNDTLGRFWDPTLADGAGGYDTRSGRGLTADADGNIIASQWKTLFKFDYKTGKVLNKVEDVGFSLTEATVDDDGNVYVGSVAAADTPIKKYSSDFSASEDILTMTGSYSRDFQVSGDGNTIWWAGYTLGAVLKYTRPDEFSGFNTIPDTVLVGIKSEAFDLHPTSGELWVGAGSTADFPDTDKYRPETFYAFNVADLGTENEEPVDSILWNSGTIDGTYGEARPRGIDFSPDGEIAYIGMFGAGSPSVQKFVPGVGTVSNENEVAELPSDYVLEQNYPNPFNPTTNINFTLKNSGLVSIKVYDMTGREVATLANGRFTAGTHTATFDASNLASGVYLYSLQANGVRLTNKMTLIK